jgi:hypothetical protein
MRGPAESLTVSPGVMLVETTGTSMWPALRGGDLVFGHPFRAGECPRPGTVLVVEGPHGLTAHRLERCRGRAGRRRFLLAGDLSGPDFPFHEHEMRGVAEVLYRKGIGFLEIPSSPGLGPIGRRLVRRLAQLWEWLERHRHQTRRSEPSVVTMRGAADDPPTRPPRPIPRARAGGPSADGLHDRQRPGGR